MRLANMLLLLNKARSFLDRYKAIDANMLSVVSRHLWLRMQGKSILAHPSSVILGLKNIDISGGTLRIGMNYVGFAHSGDIAFLNIGGAMRIVGDVSIERGCRIEVGTNAVVFIGARSYINVNTKLVIMHELCIGEGCTISWDCELLDENFHHIYYPGKVDKGRKGIFIGNRVWIGSGVRVLPGAVIPDGCIVAAGSIVTKKFSETECLIAGNPAKVIRKGVSWS